MAYHQNKQMQGESAATSGYDSADAAQPADDDIDEAPIYAFEHLATTNLADRGIVDTLTDANSCLAKQLEESAQALKEIRALPNKECNDRCARKPFAHSLENYGWTCGYKISKNHTSVNCMFSKNGHKREATKSNNMGGYQANKKLLGATSKHNSEKFE
jgi:hypothetical protein